MIQKYAKPPIIEAVIQFKLTRTLYPAQLERVSRLARKRYGEVAPMTNVDVQIDADNGLVTARRLPTGFRLGIQEDVLILQPSDFIVSRLAPYTGWDEFFERAKEDWATLEKVAGTRSISRVGLRYINRLDVPRNGARPLDYSRYCRVEITIPTVYAGTLVGLSTRYESAFPQKDDLAVVVNSAIIESPLFDHHSILLDIDVIQQNRVPENMQDVWAMLGEMRAFKNEIFESAVTDDARVLFRGE